MITFNDFVKNEVNIAMYNVPNSGRFEAVLISEILNSKDKEITLDDFSDFINQRTEEFFSYISEELDKLNTANTDTMPSVVVTVYKNLTREIKHCIYTEEIQNKYNNFLRELEKKYQNYFKEFSGITNDFYSKEIQSVLSKIDLEEIKLRAFITVFEYYKDIYNTLMDEAKEDYLSLVNSFRY